MTNPKVLIISGSIRENSYNTSLAVCADKIISSLGCHSKLVSLNSYPMPIYDGNLDEAKHFPENAIKLARLFHEYKGIMITSPEYNGSISPVLKNTIDWISRISSDEKGDVSPFKGKVSAIASASPGNMGGIFGLSHLRDILNRLGLMVIPNQVAVGGASSAFDNNNQLVDRKLQTFLRDLCEVFVKTTVALSQK